MSFSLLTTTCLFTLLYCLSLSVLAGETLRILAWPGYADADLVEKFEQRLNVKVEVSYVSTDDELWERVNANEGADFDLFAVNTAELQRYIDQGLSVPLDLDELPNLDNQLPRFRDLESIPGVSRDGRVYAIPYTYSEMGLIYDRTKVKAPPVSMEAMWNPHYRGRVLAFDTSNHNFTLAGLLLGAGNPFHLNDTEFTQAVIKLVDLRRNVLTFFRSPEEAVELFAENDVALIFGNYGNQQVKQLREAGADIGYIIPKEGALAWLDCWSMTRGVRNRELAQAWINYTLEPQVSEALTQRQGLANTVTPFPTANDSDRIIWLEPLQYHAKRESFWSRIRSGDSLEALLK